MLLRRKRRLEPDLIVPPAALGVDAQMKRLDHPQPTCLLPHVAQLLPVDDGRSGDHALLEVVLRHVLGTSGRKAECFVVQPAPGPLTRFPDHSPEGPPRVIRCNDEPARPPVFAARMKSQSTLALIHLGFLVHQEVQSVVSLGVLLLEVSHKPFYVFVAMSKCEQCWFISFFNGALTVPCKAGFKTFILSLSHL